MTGFNAFAFQGATAPTRDTQGVASLALAECSIGFQAALAKIIVAISMLVVERLC